MESNRKQVPVVGNKIEISPKEILYTDKSVTPTKISDNYVVIKTGGHVTTEGAMAQSNSLPHYQTYDPSDNYSDSSENYHDSHNIGYHQQHWNRKGGMRKHGSH